MKLTVSELIQLNQELAGVNPFTGQQFEGSILTFTIPFKARYSINKLLESIRLIMEPLVKTHKEMIDTKFGEKLEDGSVKVKQELIEEFNEYQISVLSQENEIEIPEFAVDDFKDVNSKYPFELIFKFVK